MGRQETNASNSSLELRSLDIPLVREVGFRRKRKSPSTLVPALLLAAACLAYVLWKGHAWIS